MAKNEKQNTKVGGQKSEVGGQKSEGSLLAEACKVYGIDEKYVFAHTEYPEAGEVCILTHGGTKFRHTKGQKAKFELTDVQITGKSPKKPRYVAGKKAEKKQETEDSSQKTGS